MRLERGAVRERFISTRITPSARPNNAAPENSNQTFIELVATGVATATCTGAFAVGADGAGDSGVVFLTDLLGEEFAAVAG